MASPSVEPNDLFGVKGLVVVVTGGGSGIGLMMVNALESNGAIVYVIGRRKETLEKAAATAKHGNIRIIQGDVSNKADLERAVAEIKSAVGYVNVVVANSGVPGPTMGALPQNPSISDFRNFVFGWDTAEFNNTYAVNSTGVFFTVAAFLELLDEGNKRGNLKQKSQVIATSSIGAYNRVPAAGYAYGSSKAGVVHMMKQLATALVPYGIRSNVIAPGFYPSEMTEPLLQKRPTQEWPKSVVPEQRLGDQEDIAGAILFLVSKAGAYINGNVLVTDGGRLGVVPAAY
ncbi:Rhamnolipids biosynthesis 3-oxoacyl-[acyl-carrier-protein] reductase [Daldinia childiae]|uniref:Rhamnolipids biosynthesis 3-oxoacyl-[acyl-carrier-protein] reductase n=1 Tax=Daldinia childiae TaxID=326645 RepID=UPI00144785DB|nr:Rhamnolipids biosynthesis 3-oxoacyl-[acyl-carrier-protein] reductase [Daldinia childiae]KAF3067191.1 Rhamnolipids biosynthesis 3-oxoacyl-[acyl-carrier-protein] reductase [Daldinia childiae]